MTCPACADPTRCPVLAGHPLLQRCCYNPDVARIDRPVAKVSERQDIVDYLRGAIADGYPAVRSDAFGKCVHGTFEHEDCIPCYDAHLHSILDAIEAREAPTPPAP